MRIEWIEWIDASSCGGEWIRDEEIDTRIKQTKIISCGFVVRENDESIVLSGARDNLHDNWDNPFVIPKCSIIERYEIVFSDT